MYNIRYVSDLGVGKVVVRRIPCTCKSCTEQLVLPWGKNKKNCNQKRYDVKQ